MCHYSCVGKKKGRSPASLRDCSCSLSARCGASAVPGPSPSLPSPAASSSRGPERQAVGAACDGRLPLGTRLGFTADFVGSHSFPHLASRLSRLWSLSCSSHDSFCVVGFPLRFVRRRLPRSGLSRVTRLLRFRWIRRIATLTGTGGGRRMLRRVPSRGVKIGVSAGG